MLATNTLTLLIDCALKSSVVALSCEGRILVQASSSGEQSHSLTLLSAIDHVLDEAKSALSQIQQVVFSHGPGGFSSLRVGLATLSGLFIGTDVKLFPVSSLLLRCLSQAEDQRVISVMRGQTGQVFMGLLDGADFKEVALPINEAVLQTQNFAPDIICGDGAQSLMAAGLSLSKTRFLPDLVTPEAFLKVEKVSPFLAVAWDKIRLSYFREAV